MEEPAGPDVRYTAFLSYSHKDAAAAARLHRRLESYRVPKRLVGTETPRGPVPARLWPIFRDREELPAASDLSETVRIALAQSGALIILCSPSAAGSLWVAEEIETFRKLHPHRPILAAILAGDPPDCFPAALRAFGQDGTWHEPLATDLRPGKDGRHLGLLKLVAGITGIGLDDLVQRDAARRIRRVMAVTAVAVIAMVVMAALAVVALNARREAERQRNEAEGLAKFMLTDLRERLRGVGRLDIMRAVDDRALAYHDRQLALYDRPTDRVMRARVLQAIGEDDIWRGNLDAALPILREAHRITGEELEREPSEPEHLLDHARSEYWIGRIYELRQDWPVARRQYVRFAAAADRLITMAPDNPDYMMQVGWSAFDLGNVQLNGTRDFNAAQHSYEKAVNLFGQAERARPRDETATRARANAYAALADSFFMRATVAMRAAPANSLFINQLWRHSLDARMRQYRIVERLHRADPTNLENAFRFGLAQRALGVAFAKVGDLGHARQQMLGAYEWSIRLSHQDPLNGEWLLFRAQVACELIYRDLGLPAGVSRASLVDGIIATKAALDRLRDPRARSISRCVDDLQGSNRLTLH